MSDINLNPRIAIRGNPLTNEIILWVDDIPYIITAEAGDIAAALQRAMVVANRPASPESKT